MTYGDVLNRAMELSIGKPDIFVYYSPHVNHINVQIYENGWKYGFSDKVIDKTFRIDESSPEDVMHFINNTTANDNAEEHY